jgi:phosphoribosylanthranilate isomerase
MRDKNGMTRTEPVLGYQHSDRFDDLNPQPYVGVTGPVSVDEVKQTTEAYRKAGYSMHTEHIPMMGFLVSHKTLNKENITNRRYPKIEKIPMLLQVVDNQALTMIHYNTKETDTLALQTDIIFRDIYQTGLCRAMQLNIVWPPVKEIKKIKESYPEMSIIFQANHKLFIDNTIKGVVERIQQYEETIDYVLIDPSGGRGLDFDLEHSIEFYQELNEKTPHLTVGFAGGLTGENVKARLETLICSLDTKYFCIDAEGGLRDKLSEEYGDDLFNKDKVAEYLKESAKVLL